MAWILFIDESGQDRGNAHYEVLAGVAVEDSRVWALITSIQASELRHFGRRAIGPGRELKARELLKPKSFRHAAQMGSLEAGERAAAAKGCLEKGLTHAPPTRLELTGLAQAKLAFCADVLELCSQHQTRAFASIVPREAPRPEKTFLRKDYAYLFERLYGFLEDQAPYHQGLVVFDELDKTASHVLISQMEKYFRETGVGRMRSSRIVPEPFFVHSDLTTLVRVADIVAYVTSWGLRLQNMGHPKRAELDSLARQVLRLRYRAMRERDGAPFVIWSFKVIDDLRPRDQREADDEP